MASSELSYYLGVLCGCVVSVVWLFESHLLEGNNSWNLV